MIKIPEKIRTALPYALSLAVLTVLFHTVHALSRQIHYSDIVHELRDTSPNLLISALAFTILSFIMLMFMESTSLRMARLRVPKRQAYLVSFLSQAIVHTTGFSIILGASIRYRLYGSSRISLADVTRAQLIFSSGFGLASIILLAGTFLLAPTHMSAHIGGQALAWQLLGATLLFGAGGLLGWGVSGKKVKLLGRSFTPPSTGHSVRLLVLSMLDIMACAAALYVLLPAGLGISYFVLLGAFVAAILIGLVCHVPGGLGVFEAAILLLLSPAPELAAACVGALLLFRVIYYLLPFMLAGVVLTSSQSLPFSRMGRWLTPLAPTTSAVLTAIVGTILIFSGITPSEHHRIHLLGEWLPVNLIEASHLLASITGLVLIVVAYSLRQRLRSAWLLASVLSIFGIILALAKGLEYGTALLLTLNVIMLLPSRKAFYRRGSLLKARPTLGWWISIFLVLSTALWLLFFSYRHVQYSDELWWQFEVNAQASRSLRALLAVAVVTLLLGLRNLLRPAPSRHKLPDAAELQEAATLLSTQPDPQAWIAMTGDKHLLWNEAHNAFLMYGMQGRTWVALGEPVAAGSDTQELLWQFLEQADRYGSRPAFYQVGSENLPAYIDLGLRPYKLGENALVNLGNFSLQGGARSNLRASCNKAEKAGVSFEVLPPAQLADVMDELEAVSTEWLEHHQAREKRFSLGSFSRAYLTHLPIALVRHEGRIAAFANIWPGQQAGGTLSIDLMRHRTNAPAGTMDYLFVQIMLWGKAQGYGWFDLGMAPLSGLPEHHLAGNWAQVARLLVKHGENFYNFRGLRSYKNKFTPVWQPRYLLCKPHHLAPVLLDISALISGGIRGIIMK